jgi:hypothetical protein
MVWVRERTIPISPHYGPLSTQPLIEMNSKKHRGGKARPAHDCQPHRQLWADFLVNMWPSTSIDRMDLHGLLQG